jgi:hypothetical protein
MRLCCLEAKRSQVKMPGSFETAAPIVVERFDRGGAWSAVSLVAEPAGRRAPSKLERTAATSWFRPSQNARQGRSSQAPLRSSSIGAVAFVGTSLIEGARLLGVATRSLLQLRHRRPQPHNFRMNRSVKDKVQVEPTAAGRLSWC